MAIEANIKSFQKSRTTNYEERYFSYCYGNRILWLQQ
jgi:hypothetical protein